MVIDTSAVIAILKDEPEREHFIELISSVPGAKISAACYAESSMVVESRNGHAGLRDLKSFILLSRITVASVDEEQARIASEAFSQYGKSRHPAALNLGDCFSYALSKQTGEPLLFKGDDFTKTDLVSATHG
ncbi:MAG: type II toxin-antitoxin system VapC family toxin [Spirochaetales bacterium]|jgi:ribonuclease VapC|nr:type II toxin-antitoxin system VapC family toxin [Spirochaetales bacterium]